MNKEHRTRGDGRAVEDIAPDGEKGLWQTGGIRFVNAFGNRQTVPRVHGDIFGITAAIGQRRHPVARLPAINAITQRDDFSRHLKTQKIRRPFGWRIQTLALNNVRAVDADGGHADQHLARTGRGYRPAAGLQYVGPARLACDNDRHFIRDHVTLLLIW